MAIAVPPSKEISTFDGVRDLRREPEPIGAISDRDQRKSGASDRTGNAVNASAIPLNWAAALTTGLKSSAANRNGR